MANELRPQSQEAASYLERRIGFPLPTLLAFPKYFQIEPINTCNARCIMCGIDFDAKVKAKMQDELFEKIVAEIARHKEHVEKVMIYLDCEPLLDKRLPKKIRKMKEAGIRWVNIATNASLLNEKNAIALIEAGLDEIYITLDSLIPEVYEKIRVGLKYEVVYRNIRRFIELRNEMNPELAVRLQLIEQELNHTEKDDFQDHWKPLLKPNDQIVVQKEHNWANKINTMQFGGEADVNHIPCLALWGTLCIHVDGTVSLCCMDSEHEFPLGDVVTSSIEEVWRGEALNKVRQKHLEGTRNEISLCDGCTLWRDNKQDKIELF